MANQKVIFEIHWEPWYSFRKHGPFWERNNPLVDEPTKYLLDLLRRHNAKATFYVVGWLRARCPLLFSQIVQADHMIGDHTYYHKMPDNSPLDNKERQLFRAPRWKGEKRLFSGGFWMRLMPYWWVKREVEKTGVLFLHPHDLLEIHPDCGNPIKTFERRIGLKNVRDKLERLCREVKFNNP